MWVHEYSALFINIVILTLGALDICVVYWDLIPLERNPVNALDVTLVSDDNFVKLRQGSARDGSQGERPQSLKPCQELTLKLVATFPPTRKSQYT